MYRAHKQQLAWHSTIGASCLHRALYIGSAQQGQSSIASMDCSRQASHHLCRVPAIHAHLLLSQPLCSASCHSCPLDTLTTTVQLLFLTLGCTHTDASRHEQCVQDLEAGPIKSVHFSQVAKSRLEGAHTPEEDYFSPPDFVVGSTTGSIVAVRSGSFEETSSDVPAHRLLV